MEALYSWIQNITYYLLFLAVLNQLLPGKKYAKYLKLFSGMVLILLFVQPFTKTLRVDEKLARYYEEFVFQYEAGDLKQEILGMESRRLSQVIEQYEEAVAMDVSNMAKDSGYYVADCRVSICQDKEAEAFGTVEQIFLTVSQDELPEQAVEAIRPVEPVVIGEDEAKEAAQEDAEPPEAVAFRKKVASYYDLGENHVEIQIIKGKR